MKAEFAQSQLRNLKVDAVDTPAQGKIQDILVVNVNWITGNPPELTTISYLGVGTVPLPVQSLPPMCNVIASHRRCHWLDHEADQVHKHMSTVEL